MAINVDNTDTWFATHFCISMSSSSFFIDEICEEVYVNSLTRCILYS